MDHDLVVNVVWEEGWDSSILTWQWMGITEARMVRSYQSQDCVWDPLACLFIVEVWLRSFLIHPHSRGRSVWRRNRVISLETWSEILQLENMCLSRWKLYFLALNIGSETVYPDIRCLMVFLCPSKHYDGVLRYWAMIFVFVVTRHYITWVFESVIK